MDPFSRRRFSPYSSSVLLCSLESSLLAVETLLEAVVAIQALLHLIGRSHTPTGWQGSHFPRVMAGRRHRHRQVPWGSCEQCHAFTDMQEVSQGPAPVTAPRSSALPFSSAASGKFLRRYFQILQHRERSREDPGRADQRVWELRLPGPRSTALCWLACWRKPESKEAEDLQGYRHRLVTVIYAVSLKLVP